MLGDGEIVGPPALDGIRGQSRAAVCSIDNLLGGIVKLRATKGQVTIL